MSELIRLEQKLDKNFKTICLEPIENPALSWKAKGLHTYLISRPPGWKLWYKDLTQRAKDGKASVGTAVKELQEAGYLRIERLVDGNMKVVGYRWIVAQRPDMMPDEGEPYTENQDTDTEPYTDFPDTENPDTENRTHSSYEVLPSITSTNDQYTSADEPRPDSSKPSTKDKTYPSDWYRRNEDDYQRIKGITLAGPEFGPVQRDLKLIYKAGHSPDDVAAFMGALESSGESWTANWTIKTVRMKLAEFKAGKLFNDVGPSRMLDESYDPEIYERRMKGVA